MIKLEKGAPVRVRLHTGEVVEAVYDERGTFAHNWVEYEGRKLMTVALNRHLIDGRCRCVGPSCVLLPVGVSV